VGQAVAATGAGYSQYATLKAATCFPIREATPEAVAVSLSGLTAAAALLVIGNPQCFTKHTSCNFSAFAFTLTNSALAVFKQRTRELPSEDPACLNNT
jgi:hypothetical protein